MQSSRGLHLHGATPSPPDRSDTNAIPGSFHPPESVPPSPPYYINPHTDQRLTGSIMSYPQLDHHSLPRYGPAFCLAPTLLTMGVRLESICISASTYHDTVSWPYQQWNTPMIDTGTSSENPSSVPLHTLGGMVSATHEGSTFVSPLPPARSVQPRSHFFGASTSQV